MTPESERNACGVTEQLFEYALDLLPASEAPAVEAHVSACPACRREMEALRPVVDAFVAWPADVLRPTVPLWERLSARLGGEVPIDAEPSPPRCWMEPEWQEVGPGLFCKLLSTDTERHRVSMLVRLAPGADCPPHRHAGVEELHLLDGELMIDDRKLYPGDYNRAMAGTVDHRVWSQTGCTCVLIASTRDEFR